MIFKVKFDGLSGRVEFDNSGLRSNITVDILELTEVGLERVGKWTYGMENPANRLKITRQPILPSKIVVDDDSLKNKTLKILTSLVSIGVSQQYFLYKFLYVSDSTLHNVKTGSGITEGK